jgi:peptidoglycan/LPS O-acetylase OafA/YrhL
MASAPKIAGDAARPRPAGWAHPRGVAKERLVGLDLLRASAILAVLAAHFGTSALRLAHIEGFPYAFAQHCGFYGVELFFALSGFLIGGLLLEIIERDPSVRSWVIFLIRRWMRTLPVYMLWIVVLLVILPPTDLWHTAVKYLVLLQNFAWPMPDNNWFGVSWSLTIEEWFYLLFSGLLLALAARNKDRALVLTCAIFLVAPYLARLSVPVGDWDAGMRKVVLLRLDAISYGVVMAWLYRYRPAVLSKWRYAALALGLLLVALPLISAMQPLIGPTWRASVFIFVSIGFSLTMPWAVRLRIPWSLLRAPIRWLAERSYCLYIIHVTVQQLTGAAVTNGYIQPVLAGPALLLTCACIAEMSFRFLEMPILRCRPRQFPRLAERPVPARTEPEFAPQPI